MRLRKNLVLFHLFFFHSSNLSLLSKRPVRLEIDRGDSKLQYSDSAISSFADIDMEGAQIVAMQYPA